MLDISNNIRHVYLLSSRIDKSNIKNQKAKLQKIKKIGHEEHKGTKKKIICVSYLICCCCPVLC